MPRQRSAKALKVDAKLREAARAMLEAGETVSARALARRGGLGAASSITRDPARRAVLTAAVAEQEKRREWVRRSRKESTAQLVKALAARDETIAILNRRVQLLTASHVALIRAVGEIGGTKAWLRFFAGYETSLAELREIGAIPDALSGEAPPGQPKRPRRSRGAAA